jgi:two-component system, cell cycle sensor histidine kinase and response regulator CckA
MKIIEMTRNNAYVGLLAATVGISIFVADLVVELGVAVGVAYVIPVLISLQMSRRRYALLFALAGTAMTIVGLFAAPSGGESWKVISNRAISLILIWAVAVAVWMVGEALRRSEANYRTLVENIAARTNLKNSQGRYVVVSQDFATAVGLPKERIIGRTAREIYGEGSDLDASTSMDEEVILAGEARRFEQEIHSDNETRVFQVSKAPIIDSNGERSGIVTVGVDITDLRRVEQQVRLQATALESAANGIIITDRDGTIQYVNRAFTTITGYAADEAIGQSPRILKSGVQDDEYYQKLWTTIRKGKVWRGEMINRRKDGSLYTEEQSITPVRDEDGAITSFVIIMSDVTERKRSDETQLRTEKQYRLVFDSLREPISVKDAEGRYIVVNQAFSEIFGMPAEEIVGKRLEDLGRHGDDVPISLAYDIEALTTLGPVEYQNDLLLPDGARTHVVRKAPLMDEEGNPYRLVTISWDITDRERLEDQLVHAQKLESVGRLAGGVAHDFNNMLTAIMGYAELGRRAQTGEGAASQSFQEILEVAERAVNLTRQLLTFSRTQPSNPVLVNLNEVVLGMDSMLRRLIGEDVELVALTTPEPLKVKVDRGQMEQVLTNLVVNARDAMPNGGKISVETAKVGLDQIALRVSDTGVGMTEDVIQRIFEPFFTTKGVGEGSGLGLSTSYGIVTQSGGRIDVDSELGKGTTLSVILPKAEGDTESPSLSGTIIQTGGTETILLVEDESKIRSMTARALTDLGYEVLEAANGIDAVSIVETGGHEKIDLLLTDLVMPMLGGRETARRIRNLLPDIKVLFVSGFQGDARAEPSVSESGGQFLAKPFSLKLLATRVRETIDESQA